MPEQLAGLIAQARRTAASARRAPVEKTIWGSPAGKKRLADRLVAMLPAHKTYVEPFAGSAAVLFAKEPAEVEVINDADPEIADAYKLLKKLTPEELRRLKKLPWTGDENTFKGLLDATPASDVERLHRFLYLTHFSYGKMRGRTFSPNVQGIEAKTIGRIEQFAPRLAKVKIHSGDYEPVVRKYDAPDTTYFLDPPYPGYNVDVGESDFDEERFFGVLQSLKGNWLMTYGIRGKLPAMLKDAGYFIKRIRTPRTIGAMRGVGGPSVLTQLLVANYKFVEKHTDAFDWLEDWTPEPASLPPIRKVGKLFKDVNPDDERYVLGVVLVPEQVDAQGDIYSHEEVRQAAHLFMEEFGGLGLMHQLRVNDQVKVLESYLAPTDFQIGEVVVPRGTWLLAVRVLSDELWQRVRNGELTGFSIGGSARRVPEPTPAESEVAVDPNAPTEDAPAIPQEVA